MLPYRAILLQILCRNVKTRVKGQARVIRCRHIKKKIYICQKLFGLISPVPEQKQVIYGHKLPANLTALPLAYATFKSNLTNISLTNRTNSVVQPPYF